MAIYFEPQDTRNMDMLNTMMSTFTSLASLGQKAAADKAANALGKEQLAEQSKNNADQIGVMNEKNKIDSQANKLIQQGYRGKILESFYGFNANPEKAKSQFKRNKKDLLQYALLMNPDADEKTAGAELESMFNTFLQEDRSRPNPFAGLFAKMGGVSPAAPGAGPVSPGEQFGQFLAQRARAGVPTGPSNLGMMASPGIADFIGGAYRGAGGPALPQMGQNAGNRMDAFMSWLNSQFR